MTAPATDYTPPEWVRVADIRTSPEAAAIIGIDDTTLSRWANVEGIINSFYRPPGDRSGMLFTLDEVERVRDAYAAGTHRPRRRAAVA